jgi:hypothetical protein
MGCERIKMVKFTNWEDAVVKLKNFTGETTAAQKELADGLSLSSIDVPALVTAARLKVTLSNELMFASKAASDTQWEYICDLARDCDRIAPTRPAQHVEASAWIEYFQAVRSIQALERLGLEPGDVVSRIAYPRDIFVVSSFSADGSVNFSGGFGGRDYPHRIQVKARKGECGKAADAARMEAKNYLEKRRYRNLDFNSARIAHLEKYRINEAAAPEAIEELTICIGEARDERPIQDLLTIYPALLRPIAVGNLGMWVIPLKKLGDTYVADFIVGHRDSTGVHWIYLELESPNAVPVIQSGLQGKELRKGVSQIHEWRHWVEENLHTARNAPIDGGGGLTIYRRGRLALFSLVEAVAVTSSIRR